MNKLLLIIITLLVTLSACRQNELVNPEVYECTPAFNGTSAVHPKAAIYQEILDRNRRLGIIGATLLVKDSDGLWLGSSGKANIKSQIELASCNPFMIASITKVFTASAIFRYVDQGLLNIEDPISAYLDQKHISNIANASEAKIKHLLSHTSGLPDYYTTQYQLDQINAVYNDWSQEDVLKFAYGKPSTNEVGATYYYSNTNFLILGLILERVSGLPLDEVFQEEIFDPLALSSAYFGLDNPLPDNVVTGYADIFGNGRYVESTFLYKDELRTADGGIASNAFDVARFLELLMKGELISEQSLAAMTNWFDLPEEWVYDELGHTHNGYGIEYFSTPYGYAVGHTGSIYGFYTLGFYFPEQDATFILLTNNATFDNTPKTNIYHEVLASMFE